MRQRWALAAQSKSPQAASETVQSQTQRSMTLQQISSSRPSHIFFRLLKYLLRTELTTSVVPRLFL